MRILVSWLRDYVPVALAPAAIAETLASIGFEVASIEPASGASDAAGDDAVLDLEVTANRPDALSVFGVAREVATALRLPLCAPEGCDPADGGWVGPADERVPHDADLALDVILEDPELCPRYCAATFRVRVGPSPHWLADRLVAADVRPHSNVVDVTNYVLLELGHPTHAFDLSRLGGRQLRIRRARPGETLRTLDGVTRALAPDMLVIADATRAQALAGVMGGGDSEVGPATALIALESAYFHPPSIRSTSRRLGLKTEASSRFERGASPAAPPLAIERVWRLLRDMGAAAARGALIDRYPAPRVRTVVSLRQARIARLMGLAVEAPAVDETLTRLGFGVTAQAAVDASAQWSVAVPPWRVDVTREADLIEEVARHRGYDAIPATFPALATAPPPPDVRLARDAQVRRTLTAGGFSEATTFTFIEREAAALFADEPAIVPIANPLSEKHAVLRPALVPGVLDSVVHNRRRGLPDVRLFEIGRRFSPDAGEQRALGLVWVGSGTPEHWSAKARPADFSDIKGIVTRLAGALGLETIWEPAVARGYLEGRTARVSARGARGEAAALAVVGQIHPDVTRARGLPDGDVAFAAEIDGEALGHAARDQLHVAPLPRHPAIVRDLSVVVDDALPAMTVRDTIRSAAPPALVDVRVFDRYRGKGVPDGAVSLSLRLTFRAPDRTLTDDEVQAAMDVILHALERAHDARRR